VDHGNLVREWTNKGKVMSDESERSILHSRSSLEQPKDTGSDRDI
jgi:hypothetical protein